MVRMFFVFGLFVSFLGDKEMISIPTFELIFKKNNADWN